MTLAPLLAAPPIISLHVAAALAAFLLGGVQLLAPKGTLPHRAMGYVWAALLAFVALSSFWIHRIHQFGDFSLIHLLSIFTLLVLPLAILKARRHDVARHRRSMVLLYVGALVIAGAFTLLPHRLMHQVVFNS
jgi:uncharacterized membrane protein